LTLVLSESVVAVVPGAGRRPVELELDVLLEVEDDMLAEAGGRRPVELELDVLLEVEDDMLAEAGGRRPVDLAMSSRPWIRSAPLLIRASLVAM
jgi:hypothetical protein